jgi:DnaK suppressor protein
MPTLTKNQITYLQANLEELKTKLREQLAQNKSSAEIVNLDQTLVGRLSRVDAIQQQGVAIRARQNTTFRLRKIQTALRAIESEYYGYCGKCDQPIEYARLEAQPEANLCISCQDKADH